MTRKRKRDCDKDGNHSLDEENDECIKVAKFVDDEERQEQADVVCLSSGASSKLLSVSRLDLCRVFSYFDVMHKHGFQDASDARYIVTHPLSGHIDERVIEALIKVASGQQSCLEALASLLGKTQWRLTWQLLLMLTYWQCVFLNGVSHSNVQEFLESSVLQTDVTSLSASDFAAFWHTRRDFWPDSSVPATQVVHVATKTQDDSSTTTRVADYHSFLVELAAHANSVVDFWKMAECRIRWCNLEHVKSCCPAGPIRLLSAAASSEHKDNDNDECKDNDINNDDNNDGSKDLSGLVPHMYRLSPEQLRREEEQLEIGEWSEYDPYHQKGVPTSVWVTSFSDFAQQWQTWTCGLLPPEFWQQVNGSAEAKEGEAAIVAAGGSVEQCLRSVACSNPRVQLYSDIDLFVIGKTQEARRSLWKRVLKTLATGPAYYAAYQSVVTIASCSNSNDRVRNLQVVLTSCDSLGELLGSFDMDYVRCAFDGKSVHVLPSCALAAQRRVASNSGLQCGRALLTSSSRLLKALDKGFGLERGLFRSYLEDVHAVDRLALLNTLRNKYYYPRLDEPPERVAQMMRLIYPRHAVYSNVEALLHQHEPTELSTCPSDSTGGWLARYHSHDSAGDNEEEARSRQQLLAVCQDEVRFAQRFPLYRLPWRITLNSYGGRFVTLWPPIRFTLLAPITFLNFNEEKWSDEDRDFRANALVTLNRHSPLHVPTIEFLERLRDLLSSRLHCDIHLQCRPSSSHRQRWLEDSGLVDLRIRLSSSSCLYYDAHTGRRLRRQDVSYNQVCEFYVAIQELTLLGPFESKTHQDLLRAGPNDAEALAQRRRCLTLAATLRAMRVTVMNRLTSLLPSTPSVFDLTPQDLKSV